VKRVPRSGVMKVRKSVKRLRGWCDKCDKSKHEREVKCPYCGNECRCGRKK
jgi:hypothetical protein